MSTRDGTEYLYDTRKHNAPFMAVTAHAGYDHVWYIEHNTPVKSHPRLLVEPSPSLDMGTGIHGAFNIITSNCGLRHGLSAYAFSKEQGDNSMLRFLINIQDMERGNIGAGVVEVRHVKSARYECFYDELVAADAIDSGMSDRWGHESTSLPQFTYGYKKPITVSNYTAGDQYQQLGTTLRACVIQPAAYKGPRRPSHDERA